MSREPDQGEGPLQLRHRLRQFQSRRTGRRVGRAGQLHQPVRVDRRVRAGRRRRPAAGHQRARLKRRGPPAVRLRGRAGRAGGQARGDQVQEGRRGGGGVARHRRVPGAGQLVAGGRALAGVGGDRDEPGVVHAASRKKSLGVPRPLTVGATLQTLYMHHLPPVRKKILYMLDRTFTG
uniref:Uncharacterized protein n=1 Tax=Aegilops tauschii subsp. strangulata TaxID=200361 RepID=A0A453FJV8_AEGTS